MSAALSKFKSWNTFKANSNPSAAKRAEILEMKKTAKGDSKVNVTNRVYVQIEGVDPPKKQNMYFDRNIVVGAMLDKAAQSLQIMNYNNMKDDDEKKLRVYHVDQGKVLNFSDKLNDVPVRDGDHIALVRGVKMPKLM
ncbi:hypothetical protein CANCADRAFT_2847 [Tortispora caseinolytica NRRL Y-17796]|uniref:ZFAND1-like ubiquitin-like domain-containing protein n=1 Tax=Tortispora caseinolytica NRRL Y-17796 TaxID=767744 RepID=A0A1E4THB1_9ASCO|nr:hypothetical protein CANCADRAFT_2847 [Tortispora caseinolytica NRRL Y-17796]